MEADIIWKLFAETGDIEYYLIYKAETGTITASGQTAK